MPYWSERDHRDAERIVLTVRKYEGDIVGQPGVARHTGLTKGRIGFLMPLATELAAKMFPGESLKIHKPDNVYRISDSCDWNAIALGVGRFRKAGTGAKRFVDECSLDDPNAQALRSLAQAAALISSPEVLDTLIAAIKRQQPS